MLLPLALCGFAVAQPVYQLLLQTPVFLVARQNMPIDIWALVILLSIALPLLISLPGWLTRRRWPLFSSTWYWFISSVFAGLFIAQLLLPEIGEYWFAYLSLVTVIGGGIAWALMFTKWSALNSILALLAAMFPLWFVFFSPVLEQVDYFAAVSPVQQNPGQDLPDIVFVILDELPLATLIDENGNIDKSLFPGFARLQSISDWYFDTISVSDGTGAAVPAILTGQYPHGKLSGLTVASTPVNLFTILRHHYSYNVAEAVTRFCPQALCPRVGPDDYSRIWALLLDLSAIYLHRIVPDRWNSSLPPVTNNWSGFFADRQVFFPEGWMKHAGAQTEIDRPAYFNQFTDSIQKRDKPVLNFMHILFPHEPNAYLPGGQNYGLSWMRGQKKELWGDVEWGVISGKQRHFLQVQYVDQLLNRLLDHLQTQQMLKQSMIVLVADHGISFALNDTRRALTSINKAALLRVPLFIKHAGQQQGRRITQPVMTIDILPTLLAALGISPESLDLDGIDMATLTGNTLRPRRANSYIDRELKIIDEADLDITHLVVGNRKQLKLSDPKSALWEIGPYDHLRGQTMDAVCEKSAANMKVHFGDFKALPNTNPEDSIHAYIKGTFTGKDAVKNSMPFLITNNDLIIASGHTWVLNEYPKFFALVEPKYIRQENWKPEAWLIVGNRCLGEIEH